jgi:hypothetical protein
LNLNNYYEWRGQVIMFGDKSLMIFSVPPTLNPPLNMQMSYQTRGSLNRTYTMNFTKIIFVLPKSKETGSLTMVNSHMLGAYHPDGKNHLSSLFGSGICRISIDEVKIGAPYLYFNQSTEELLDQESCTIDVYYNQYPNFVHKRYIIEFVHSKSRKTVGLWIFLGVMLAIFISISILCIVKSCKAFRKIQEPVMSATPGLALTPGLPDGNRRVLIRGAKDELINKNMPSRLKNRDLGED